MEKTLAVILHTKGTEPIKDMVTLKIIEKQAPVMYSKKSNKETGTVINCAVSDNTDVAKMQVYDTQKICMFDVNDTIMILDYFIRDR